jgi:biotin carboxyl carrier protein
MKNNYVINGNKYEVEIENLTSSPIEVIVNGKKYEVLADSSFETTAQPATSAPVPKSSPAVAAAPVKAAPKPASSSPVDGNADEVRSPMPGVIRDVVVRPGDSVKAGQQLVALEAMKMKNAIRSPKDAVVASVEVTDGQKVAYGDLLVRLS